MKKTRHQLRCESLAKKLKPLNERQKAYGYSHVPPFIMKWYGKEYCSECGSQLSKGVTEGEWHCSCGAEFDKETEILKGKRGKAEVRYYFGIETTVGGMQVHRNFLITKRANKGRMAEHSNMECCRVWSDSKGHVAIQAAPVALRMWGDFRWIEGKGLKTVNVQRSRIEASRYNIADWIDYPTVRKAEWFRKKAPGGKPKKSSWLEWRLLIEKEPMAEWLAKKGLTNMLNENPLWKLKGVKRELELAEKHGYKIKDTIKWVDMVNMFRECGKDTLNGKWSRPESLENGHRQAMRLLERKRKKEREEEAKKHEKEYRRDKKAFFGMIFTNENIIIRTIESVAEMIEEGERMHHCVGSYYKEKDSLILTARNNEGERLATIEWSITEKKIIQCQGIQNTFPEKYKEIIALIRKNKKEIEKRTKKWRQSA